MLAIIQSQYIYICFEAFTINLNVNPRGPTLVSEACIVIFCVETILS